MDTTSDATDRSSTYLLPRSTTVDERNRGATVAVLPIGSLEQHGPHLPLTTDTVIACTIAQAIADVHDLMVLSPITISCSHEHAAWPGTVSISAATLYAVVRDIAASLRLSGITKLILVNAHGGNYVLGNVVQEASAARHDMALFPGERDWVTAREAAGMHTSIYTDMHAGELETSVLLHAHPTLVTPGYESADHLADDRPHLLTLGLAPYTESGTVGLPSLATAGKGRDLLASLVTSFGGYL